MSLSQSETELERLVAERTAELVAGLQESDARFRALIENSLDITAIVDVDMKVLYVSPSVTRILGYTVEEVLGPGALAFVHPEDAGVIADVFARATQHATGLE